MGKLRFPCCRSRHFPPSGQSSLTGLNGELPPFYHVPSPLESSSAASALSSVTTSSLNAATLPPSSVSASVTPLPPLAASGALVEPLSAYKAAAMRNSLASSASSAVSSSAATAAPAAPSAAGTVIGAIEAPPTAGTVSNS